MKVLVFAASLRKESYNKKLAAVAANLLKLNSSLEVDLADFRDFSMPVYDGDLEDASGIPAGAQVLIRKIQSSNAVVISAPEYNGGIAGALKNATDWVSRAKPNPFDKKPVLLLGATPGALGAVRGLWHTRVPFEALGAFVYPQMFGIPKAHEAFDESGSFRDGKNRDNLGVLANAFVEFAAGR